MSNKIKYEMEFPIQASPSLLYQYLSTPSGLSEWYADNVNSRGEIFTFIWEGSEEQAKLLSKKSDERIKMRWLEDEEEGQFCTMCDRMVEIETAEGGETKLRIRRADKNTPWGARIPVDLRSDLVFFWFQTDRQTTALFKISFNFLTPGSLV